MHSSPSYPGPLGELPPDPRRVCGFSRIINAILAGEKIIEREILHPLAREQMQCGDITIRTQYHDLRRVYLYFREGSEIAYAGEDRLAKPENGGAWFFPERYEAWWNTFAIHLRDLPKPVCARRFRQGSIDRVFSTPDVGAVPAILGDIRTSPHFDFVPTVEEDFASICTTFDNLDS
ncbi:hypothetical protein ACH347_36940 [Saccharopolyspora sp. 5N102]|uniref:hypothetical protein n=1 Tax=Saccharopolyspora sp. 5N102 TaxID=3375155 RepID=UPI00379A4A9E